MMNGPRIAQSLPEKYLKSLFDALVVLKPVVAPRLIAWSTKSASNGRIYQWSRWHLTHDLVRGGKTLCGKTVPFAKLITPQPGDTQRGDYRIKGGECQECKRRQEEFAIY